MILIDKRIQYYTEIKKDVFQVYCNTSNNSLLKLIESQLSVLNCIISELEYIKENIIKNK